MQTASPDKAKLVRGEGMAAKLENLDARLEETARRIEEVWGRLLDEDEEEE